MGRRTTSTARHRTPHRGVDRSAGPQSAHGPRRTRYPVRIPDGRSSRIRPARKAGPAAGPARPPAPVPVAGAARTPAPGGCSHCRNGLVYRRVTSRRRRWLITAEQTRRLPVLPEPPRAHRGTTVPRCLAGRFHPPWAPSGDAQTRKALIACPETQDIRRPEGWQWLLSGWTSSRPAPQADRRPPGLASAGRLRVIPGPGTAAGAGSLPGGLLWHVMPYTRRAQGHQRNGSA